MSDAAESKTVTIFDPRLPITKTDLSEVKERRRLLIEFVQSQMVYDVDYGKIPGVKQDSLFKPGAEKLAQLFGLGVRYVDKDKEIDLSANFAMFSYTAEAYNLRSGAVLAQCEGSCNSAEHKYRNRTNYKTGQVTETHIGDVMNTLMKMAQKRAYVGVIIAATGASDFYTQDIETKADAEALGIRTDVKSEAASSGFRDVNEPPLHCGKPMMISKYDKEPTWYCLKCKTKILVGQEG